MNQRLLPDERRVNVLLNWEVLYGQTVSETDFVRAINQLPLENLLPPLITLLQYGDANEPVTYRELDRRIPALFPTSVAHLVADRLSQGSHWIFFSKWQLLFAIKLLCVFGAREPVEVRVNDEQFLKFLLQTNGFYSHGESSAATTEDVIEIVQKAILSNYSLMHREPPKNLIGRYGDLFGRLGAPDRQNEFKSWVDIQSVVASELGVQLDVFKAVLFALYSSSIKGSSWPEDGAAYPQLGRLNLEDYLAVMQLPEEAVNRTLELVSTSPDEIREAHRCAYGDSIGNPVDLRILLRNPAIKCPDGSLSGISGQLLIQRYTCGLYWDIHDALPNNGSAKPNRNLFQTFFGELHERYGRDTLLRIKDAQQKAGKKFRFFGEEEYATENGPNPDSLILETIGPGNTRCSLFEFKVGRPRYQESIVEGDIQAFQEDVRIKIEAGLDQEIGFCRQVQGGQRGIPDLLPENITAWLFVIVVTDPFPAMSVLLEPLQKKLAAEPDIGNAKRYGPFILSLGELEQLETLSKSRVSQLFIDWASGPHRDYPFNTFYAYRTKSAPIDNCHVSKLADVELGVVTRTLLGDLNHP